jgi:branched-chain amino acid transport system ATP-binding protein
MLELHGLRVNYGTTVAVSALDLTVPDSAATALLGANGAGKTSTLRAISRIIRSKGRIVFDGRDISRTPPEAVARRGLVHVPEGRRVFGTLSVHENLQVGATARGKRPASFGLSDVYDLFPALRNLRHRRAWALSGGEQQMVAIGRGLMASPRLLLLDEPSLGLAPNVVQTVYTALSQVKGRMPMLVVEQNATLGLELCDRGYVLVSGELVLEGSAQELSSRDALLESYLGSASVAAS